MTIRDYPIAIVGAGPIGLAAAAHLSARDIPFVLFEAEETVGASILEWGHVRLFSPWRYNIDKVSEKLLRETQWKKPPEDVLPTGKELYENYLLPLSLHPKIQPHLHLSSIVFSITKKEMHKMRTPGRDQVPFVLDVLKNGNLESYEASAVIDASGTWSNPNPVGTGGVAAKGEYDNASKIFYGIPDILNREKERYKNKSVAVIGAGHSAINSLLDLASLKEDFPKTELHWILLDEDLNKIYGGGEDDALEARGALGIKIRGLVKSGKLKIHNPFNIHEIRQQKARLTLKGSIKGISHAIDDIDEVIANTGARPNMDFLREVRVQIDPALESVPALAELIDPNIHSCGTVRAHGERELRQPEKNLYLVGVKSYGRAPTFLMATGYEQVRSVIAYLDGDIVAAQNVELNLPETGVCSSGDGASGDCCGTPVSAKAEAGINSCCSPSTSDEVNNKNNNMKNDQELKQKNETVAASGCCGGAPTKNEEACCKLDEEKKEEGLSGCGCNSSPVEEDTPVSTGSCC